MTHIIVEPWWRSDAGDDRKFANPVKLPSLKSIDKMDRLREAAINELQVSDNKSRCQNCGLAVQLADKSIPTNSTTGRISYLKRRIQYARTHGFNIDKSTKHELAQLIKEQQKQDVLKRLRLYSSKITRYRFFCSTCYDNAYKRRVGKRKLI